MQQRPELMNTLTVLNGLKEEHLNDFSDEDLILLRESLELNLAKVSLILRSRIHQCIHSHHPEQKS